MADVLPLSDALVERYLGAVGFTALEAVWFPDGLLRLYVRSTERLSCWVLSIITSISLGGKEFAVCFEDYQQVFPGNGITGFITFRTSEAPVCHKRYELNANNTQVHTCSA